MRPIIYSFMLAGLATVLGADAATAQRRRGLEDVTPASDRHGFWLSGGLGYGEESFKFSGDPDYSNGLGAPTVSLRLGGTVNPWLRLGGEATVWWDTFFDEPSGVNITESLASFLAIGQIYPIQRAGLFLKVGGGLGRTGADPQFGPEISETGFAAVGGIGYDLKVGRKVWLTPSIDLYRHWFTERNEPTLNERLIHIGVAITFQPNNR